MPKNVQGGSKHKKMKNNSNNDEVTHYDLILKSGKEQDYGKQIKYQEMEDLFYYVMIK